MKKKVFKSLGAFMLAVVMICGCISVAAEETTYKYLDVASDGETIIKVWTSAYENEMSNPERKASGKDSQGVTQTVVAVKLGQYVVFRVNILETGIYDIATIFGIKAYNKQKFNIYIDEGDAVAVGPIYNGLGSFEPEAINVLSVPLSKGEHKIKVESAGANGYLMGISLNCTAKAMKLKDAKANDASFIDYPYVDIKAQNLVVEFTEEIDEDSVTNDTVALTSGEESISITPSAEGKILTVALNEKLEQAKMYTLSLNGIADESGLTTITDVSYTFVAYEGDFSTTKYPDIVIEAEDFIDAGVYSNGYNSDSSLVEVKTEGDVTFVEFDNMEYIKIPYTIPTKSYYSIHVVYATDSESMQISVLSQYQKLFPKTADLSTFATLDPLYSSVLSAGNLSGFLRAQVHEGEKCRIDKVIIKRGMVVPANGDVSIRKMVNERDGQSDNYDTKNSILYSGSWTEYVYDFVEDGYYNLQCSAKTPVNNAINFVLSIDDQQVNTKYYLVTKATSGEADTNPIDLGTYYFEKGAHIVRVANTRPNGANIYNLLVQKTDTTDGIIADAENAADYTEGVTPALVTEIAAEQYVTLSATVDKAGYYGMFAMLSNANGEAVDYTVTVDGKDVYEAAAQTTSTLRVVKQQKIADVYLTEGTHTFKFVVGAEGQTIGVNTLRLYKDIITFEELKDGNNEAKVWLNGLFSGKEVNVTVAIYKEKDGVKQLCGIDFEDADIVKNGTAVDLSVNAVFEDGYTYTAKIFVWNNMSGNVYTY